MVGMNFQLHHARQLCQERQYSLDWNSPDRIRDHLHFASIQHALQNFRISAMQSLQNLIKSNVSIN